MKKFLVPLMVIVSVVVLSVNSASLVYITQKNLFSGRTELGDDFDPLVDLALQVGIQRVRKIAVVFDQEPSFSLRVTVGGETWFSDAFQGYDVWNVGSSTWFDIPDDQSSVSVSI